MDELNVRVLLNILIFSIGISMAISGFWIGVQKIINKERSIFYNLFNELSDFRDVFLVILGLAELVLLTIYFMTFNIWTIRLEIG